MSEIDDIDPSDGKLDEVLEHLEIIEEILRSIDAKLPAPPVEKHDKPEV